MRPIGVTISTILLPKPGVDLSKWAIVACDQYTSQPEYWQKVERLVGSAPSTLNLVFPEVYLGKDDTARIQHIQAAMHSYLAQGLLIEHDGLILIERTTEGPHGRRTRTGLMLTVDLEEYNYCKGSTSLIRATEGTIVERLPPRIKIREGAPLESPHIMVLIDDPEKTVIEPLIAQKKMLKQLYSVELMMGGGHLSGYAVDKSHEKKALDAIGALVEPAAFRKKYDLEEDLPVLLFAVGDGNHSLATAKAVWENIKKAAKDKKAIMEHPARYALIELVNVHDSGLEFEPIHRVLFDVKIDIVAALNSSFGQEFSLTVVEGREEMVKRTLAKTRGSQRFGVIHQTGFFVAEVAHPKANLEVGTLQPFLDALVKEKKAEIDYVHGTDAVCLLGAKASNAGFFLPPMSKTGLFKSVILDGALPRKTFSMGEANEKRYYFECRRILP